MHLVKPEDTFFVQRWLRDKMLALFRPWLEELFFCSQGVSASRSVHILLHKCANIPADFNVLPCIFFNRERTDKTLMDQNTTFFSPKKSDLVRINLGENQHEFVVDWTHTIIASFFYPLPLCKLKPFSHNLPGLSFDIFLCLWCVERQRKRRAGDEAKYPWPS